MNAVITNPCDTPNNKISENNIDLVNNSTSNINDDGQVIMYASKDQQETSEKCSQENEINSWDTLSESSTISDDRNENSSCWDSIEALPPELPLLCNITQQVNVVESGTLELLVVDADDDMNSWDSSDTTLSLKDVGLNTNMSEELLIHDGSESESHSTGNSELLKEDNESNNQINDVAHENESRDIGLQTDISSITEEIIDHQLIKKEIRQCSQITEVNSVSRDQLEEDPNCHSVYCQTDFCDEQEDQNKILHFSNVRKSNSSPDKRRTLLNGNILSQQATSSSVENMKQNDFLRGSLKSGNTTDAPVGEMGDSAIYRTKAKDSASPNVLKQYIEHVEPLRLSPTSEVIEESYGRNQVFECHIISLINLPDENSGEEQQVDPNPAAATQTVPQQTQNQHTETSLELRPDNLLLDEASGTELPQQALPTCTKVKHRPIKQPTVRTLKQWPANNLQSKEAWVFLDSEGNTQEVTPRDVNILLGGRSADSVVAESRPHLISCCAMERGGTRSDTGPPLEPLIQESLLLLRKDDTGGEQPLPRRLSLERKASNMLLYIGMDMNLVPSVRFIDVDTEMVDLWRHSQDFHRCSYISSNNFSVDSE